MVAGGERGSFDDSAYAGVQAGLFSEEVMESGDAIGMLQQAALGGISLLQRVEIGPVKIGQFADSLTLVSPGGTQAVSVVNVPTC